MAAARVAADLPGHDRRRRRPRDRRGPRDRGARRPARRPPAPSPRMTPIDTDAPNVPSLLLRYRTAAIVVGNLALASTAYLIAFALRFDLSLPARHALVAAGTLPVLLVC